MEAIRELLSKGEIKKAINELLIFAEEISDKDMKNLIISTAARFKINFKKKNLGLGEDDTEVNKIINTILEFLDEIEAKKIVANRENSLSLKIKLDKVEPESVFESFHELKSLVDEFGDLPQKKQQEIYVKSLELKNIMYENIDKKLKKFYPNLIFDRIYYSEDIHDIEYEELNRLPFDKEISWYEKSIVVSAITLSLVRDFNERKLELLIRFVNEFEEFVWQRALVGIILTTYEKDKLILLYPNLIQKLSELKKHERVREAIIQISIDLLTESYKTHWSEDLEIKYKNKFEYFNFPQHWFLPFYRSNPVLNNAIKYFPNVNDIHLLPELLIKDRHLSNSEKYSILLSLKDKSKEEVSSLIEDLKGGSECNRMHEFDRYIRDIYVFIGEFDDENLTLELDEEINIASKDLIEHLIDEKYIPLVKAKCFLAVDNLDSAILNYESYNSNNDFDTYSHCKLGQLYEIKEEFEKAIESHLVAYEVDKEHTHSFISIARCYYHMNKIDNCNSYLKKFDNLKSNSYDLWFGGEGNYHYSKKFDKALKFYEKLQTEKINSEDYKTEIKIVSCLVKLDRFEDAKRKGKEFGFYFEKDITDEELRAIIKVNDIIESIDEKDRTDKNLKDRLKKELPENLYDKMLQRLKVNEDV